MAETLTGCSIGVLPNREGISSGEVGKKVAVAENSAAAIVLVKEGLGVSKGVP
jgi:hypothetical protein